MGIPKQRAPAAEGAHPPRTAHRLLASLLEQPWGQMSPSVYETGRLVALAPWLTGHDRRVAFLLERQRADGGWGGPGMYALVPSLSATEALLVESRRCTPDRRSRMETACLRGLDFLASTLDGRAAGLPDTPAVEVLAPVLVEAVNRHVTAHVAGRAPLRLPPGTDPALARGIRELIRRGDPLPDKVLHALEVAGAAAHDADIQPVPPGTVGASPAATAAWLSPQRPDPAALSYLEACTRPHEGPVSSVVPITVFERAWVLDSLLRGRVPVHVPPELTASLVSALGPRGTPGGGGLPHDADTTSTTILTAHRLGARVGVDALQHYEESTHFVTWQGERTASATTNAHVLACLGGVEAGGDWQRAAIVTVARWLCGQQRPDGAWVDKWHASPYYATAAAAVALREHGGPEAAPAVARAVQWILATQRDDGSWGIWGGTAEETAYALQVLVPQVRLPAGGEADGVAAAVARGLSHLREVTGAGMPEHTPLWHDKDLYTPTAVVDAAVLAALHRGQGDPMIAEPPALDSSSLGGRRS